MSDYGKQYSGALETAYRKSVFAQNLRTMNTLKKENPLATFGINKFADLTPEEFRGTYLGYVPGQRDIGSLAGVVIPRPNQALPANFDWRQHTPTPVTPVKDQGQCGSCWAFSATEEIESAWILAGHPAAILAPQQIVDCDKLALGCNGGDPSTAYRYVMSAGGLEAEASYPYTAKHGSCHADGAKVANLASWKQATTGKNETELLYAVAQVAPVSICVDAATWQNYQSGILTKCATKLDHCVQLTGFGQTTDTTPVPYWNVRNSWGEDWGEQGYIRIARGNDLCGIAKEATIVVG
eukprot:TRINITY_DN125_c0_g1_i3.p1 TRINITY_DN125_c0_g1~~TRINITY_DN125_c0_g1_i3.p1  ORF type:complete len:343 (-),score=82.52 TRINITY_DN125_c0_g1_i3:54-941(-)